MATATGAGVSTGGAETSDTGFGVRNLRCLAAAGLKHHQMLGGYADTHFRTWQMIGMAGENRFQLAASRQLQAVEG